MVYTRIIMIIIAGLGNPGEEYVTTRHNTGRIMLEAVAKKFDFGDFEFNKKLNARVAKGKIGKAEVMLVEPETFMNNSGLSLKSLVTSAKKAEQLLVIYDDFHLGLGTLKMSFNRSSGGHNGLESIIIQLKTEAFPRLRVGICPTTPSGKLKIPSGDKGVEDLILGEFKKAELETLKKMSKQVIEAVEVFVAEGRDKAIMVANTK